MDAKEIFDEVLKSPKLQLLLKIPTSEIVKEKFDEPSKYPEIEAIKQILVGQARHTSLSAIMQNINRILIQS